MAKEKAKLPLSTDEKYTIIGDFSRRHYFGGFGEIDFNTLSCEQCAALIHGGFAYLKESPPAPEGGDVTPSVVELDTSVVEVRKKKQ